MASRDPFLCLKCSVRVTEISQRIHCGFCKSLYHTTCLPGGSNEEFFNIAKKPTSSYIWLCDSCKPLVKSSTERNYTKIQTDGIIKSQAQKATLETATDQTKEIDKYKELNTALNRNNEALKIKVNELAQRSHQINTVTHTVTTLEEQIKTLTLENNKLIQENRKRQRTDVQAEDNEILNDKIIQIMKPMFESFSEKIYKNIKKITENANTDIIEQIHKQAPETNRLSRTQNRNLSAKRSRETAMEQQPRSKSRPAIYKTFAETLMTNTEDILNIRHIKINTENEQEIKSKLQKDRCCAGINMQSIKNQSKNLITVKCADPAEAQKLEDTITRKYRDTIQVTKVNTKSPQIKIVNTDNSMLDSNIIEAIKDQNVWTRDKDITIEKTYTITTPNKTYKNVIINCVIQTQREFIERGNVIIGFDEKRCFEHINHLQCLNCQRFGHISTNCSYPTACKKCAGPHASNQCEEQSTIKKCINCIRTNKENNEFKLNTKHITTDDRCPARISRTEGLKNYHSKN